MSTTNYSQSNTLLITGAAGFIGSHFVEHLLNSNFKMVVLDSLTYAGNTSNLQPWLDQGKFEFIQGQIQDAQLVDKLFKEYNFDGVINFAAESHVDRSISAPDAFLQTNIMGVFNLLNFSRVQHEKNKNFKFLQVSTDEVYGQLGETGYFTETSPYAPNSPYSATKASADMLCRAWFHTYKLPVVITNCSNNYGPKQYPEKLIPLMISKCLHEQPLPVYGAGKNIRDWIFVKDHCAGILLAFKNGTPGETYCFGGQAERKNIDIVNTICELMDKLNPRKNGQSHKALISFVTDRAGHDFRYAINDLKAQQNLGFKRSMTFEKGLELTVKWYLEHQDFLNGGNVK